MSTLGMIAGSVGSKLVDQTLGMINQDRQQQKQKEQLDYQQKLNKDMFDYTYNKTNTTAQMEQLKKNNLNPTLMYGSGAGGVQQATTGGTGDGSVGMIQQDSIANNIQSMLQAELTNAQKENIEADTEKKKAETIGKQEETKTTIEQRIYLIEDLKQSGQGKWLENVAKRWNFEGGLDKEAGIDSYYNGVYKTAVAVKESGNFNRGIIADINESIANTGNSNAQAILNNKKAMGYATELANETIKAIAANKQAIAALRSTENEADRIELIKILVGNDGVKAAAQKMAVDYATGNETNWKTWVDYGFKLVETAADVAPMLTPQGAAMGGAAKSTTVIQGFGK